MRKDIIINSLTATGVISWILLVVHKYWLPHENIVAGYSIKLSFALSIINVIVCIYCLFKYKVSAQIVINSLMGFLLCGFFIFLLILAKITGGA